MTNIEATDNQLRILIGNPPGYDAVSRTFTSTDALRKHRVSLLLEGGDVQRFHTMPTLQRDTVAGHSHGVAMFCWMIYDEAGLSVPKNLLLSALTHDLAEAKVGDVPAPTKRALNIRSSLGAVEDAVLDTAQMGFTLQRTEELVLKIADVLDGYLFCISELHMGNKRIMPALVNFRGYLVTNLQTLEALSKSEDGLELPSLPKLLKAAQHMMMELDLRYKEACGE